MPGSPYVPSFYSYVEEHAETSAGPVAELVVDWFRPASVVDVGCGTGAWLEAFRDRGVDDVLGLDQSAVPAELLRIPPESFRTVDLAHPPPLDRTFDVTLCLEVAEHLSEESGALLVEFLTASAPRVVFSAAIPGQGGAGHVNEQWPEYWAQRFASHGYRCLDVLRARLWGDERVAAYYRQNLLLFVDRDLADEVPDEVLRGSLPGPPLALVHPGTFELVRNATAARRSAPPSLSSLLRQLPSAARRAVGRRVRGSRAGAPPQPPG